MIVVSLLPLTKIQPTKLVIWTSATIGNNISLNFQPQIKGKTFSQTTSENDEYTHFL